LLYLTLLARGAAGRVASLFYLVPPVTAVLAALLLGERFDLRDCAGFALAAVGVWLGQRA
jgi:drug/metabolite transporter (DMT)-like permease